MAEFAKTKAARHLAQIRFHQHFTLEANPEHGRSEPIRVTYADCDYRNWRSPVAPEEPTSSTEFEGGPVLLFIGGIYGSRYIAAGSIDSLARKHRIRLIVPDKFGLGGTGDVPVEWRVKSFIDLIESLMAHLKIKQVSIVSHSAGTVYLMNSILHLRHLLHPTRPFVCLLCPWVHPSHSKEFKSLNLVSDSMVGKLDTLTRFMVNRVNPLLNPVLGSVGSIKSLVQKSSQPGESSTAEDEVIDYDETVDYGAHEPTSETLQKLTIKCVFAESTRGGTDEAFILLKRGPNPTWGYFEDFEEGVSKIYQAEAATARGKADLAESLPDNAAAKSTKEKLQVKIVFAEDDWFIGNTGREWTENLWSQQGELKDAIHYESTIVSGSGHDNIGDAKFGVIDELFAKVRELWT